MHSGIDAFTAMVLLRSLVIEFKAAGLTFAVAPWVKAADKESVAHMLLHKGRAPTTGVDATLKDAVAGIAAYREPSLLSLVKL